MRFSCICRFYRFGLTGVSGVWRFAPVVGVLRFGLMEVHLECKELLI